MATVLGDTTRNYLFGTSANDKIIGFEGDDVIYGSAGADVIHGGNPYGTADPTLSDNDTVDYSQSSGPLTIDLRYALQYGGDAEGDKLYSIENIIGSKFDDYLHASETTNLLEGRGGRDQIYGWQGHGTASYASSAAPVKIDLTVVEQHGGDAEGDQLYDINNVLGSAHDDNIRGNANGNELTGGGGKDTFKGGLGTDRIDGGEGRDKVLLDAINGSGVFVQLDDGTGTGSGSAYYYGNGEVDTLISIEDVVGSDYADILWGSDADNTLNGMGADDDMHGGGGGDTLLGGFGNDTMFGDAHADSLQGEAGNDVLVGGAGGDRIVGGDGIDTASYQGSSAGVTVSLLPAGIVAGGDAEGDGLSGIENLTGSDHADRLTGDDFGNVLRGGNGSDTLIGGRGRDVLIGDLASNAPEGQSPPDGANDILSGGIDGARDVYQFNLAGFWGQPNIGNDLIIDWERFDRIQFVNGTQPIDPDVTLTQVGGNTVITIANVIGSITVQNSQVSDFDYLF